METVAFLGCTFFTGTKRARRLRLTFLSLFRSIENHSTREQNFYNQLLFSFFFFYSKEKTKLLGQVKKYLFDTINKNLYAYVQRLIVEKSYAIKGEGNRNRKSIID